MVRVYLEFDGKKWREVKKSSFWIHQRLYLQLKKLKRIQKKQWDGVIIIDGKERSGKSTLGMICGWFLSNTQLNANNFARGLHDAAKKIANLPDKSVLIVDEGSLLFSSKDSMAKEQKRLVKILDVVGQKNLIFIICLPCFFDLNKTIAVRRSLFLLHVYPDDDYNRGNFAYWGEKDKAKLYRIGKKNFDSYAYPPALWLGDYFDFEPPFYKQYLEEIKAQSLKEALGEAVDSFDPKIQLYRMRVRGIGRLKEVYPKIPMTKIAHAFELSPKSIQNYINQYKRDKIVEIKEDSSNFSKKIKED